MTDPFNIITQDVFRPDLTGANKYEGKENAPLPYYKRSKKKKEEKTKEKTKTHKGFEIFA